MARDESLLIPEPFSPVMGNLFLRFKMRGIISEGRGWGKVGERGDGEGRVGREGGRKDGKGGVGGEGERVGREEGRSKEEEGRLGNGSRRN